MDPYVLYRGLSFVVAAFVVGVAVYFGRTRRRAVAESCRACGMQLRSGASYCHNCGTKIRSGLSHGLYLAISSIIALGTCLAVGLGIAMTGGRLFSPWIAGVAQQFSLWPLSANFSGDSSEACGGGARGKSAVFRRLRVR